MNGSDGSGDADERSDGIAHTSARTSSRRGLSYDATVAGGGAFTLVSTFPDGFTPAPGERATIYTGRGTNTKNERYRGSPEEIWNDRIDTRIVRNAGNEVVRHRSYP